MKYKHHAIPNHDWHCWCLQIQLYTFLTSAAHGNVMLVLCSARFNSDVKAPLPNVQVAGWGLGLVWAGKDILTPPRFDQRTVQPVAGSYTDCITLSIWSVWSQKKLQCELYKKIYYYYYYYSSGKLNLTLILHKTLYHISVLSLRAIHTPSVLTITCVLTLSFWTFNDGSSL